MQNYINIILQCLFLLSLLLLHNRGIFFIYFPFFSPKKVRNNHYVLFANILALLSYCLINQLVNVL